MQAAKKQKRQRKNHKQSRKSIVLRVCVFLFVAYAAVLLIDMQINLAGRRERLNALKEEYEEKRIANKELELALQQGMDEEYVERIAREKLDYVAPDEKVYIDISGS